MRRTAYRTAALPALIATVLLMSTACSSAPWKRETADEVNLAFRMKNNVPVLDASVSGAAGSFIVSTGAERSYLDADFIGAAALPSDTDLLLVVGQRHPVTFRPAMSELSGLADGVLGIDVWRGATLTFDYAKRLVSLSTKRRVTRDMFRASFRGDVPMIEVEIDGIPRRAVIDTAYPDTLVLPAEEYGESGSRSAVSLRVAGIRFDVDAAIGETPSVILGGRILEHFLVTIDYRRGEIGLWHDARRRRTTKQSDRDAGSESH